MCRHGVLVYLRHEFADYAVEFQPVVMGVRASMRQAEFAEQLERLEEDRTVVARAAAGALIRAKGDVLRQRIELLGRSP